MKSKKDFEHVAALLKSLVNVDKKELYKKFYEAEFLKNPRYNEEKFFKAAGIE
mgnify:FL=1